ncbi:hypothetical protein CR513_29928, partial [Mucuna pruriens]
MLFTNASEVVRLHGLFKTIVFDKDSKILWSKLDINLLFSTTCDPQIDGQTEVTNRTLSQLLRVVNNITTSYSPFELVYGFNPVTSLDLLPLPNSNLLKKLHAKVCSHIEKKVEKYVNRANKEKRQTFFLKKRFSNLRKSKLLPWGDGLFKVIKKINDNAYIVDMPQYYKGSHTFHILDLSSFSRTQDSNLRVALKKISKRTRRQRIVKHSKTH